MFLPKALLQIEAQLKRPLPASLRRFLARRPQANVFGQFKAYPRALVMAQYGEWKKRSGNPMLIPVGHTADSELLVHVGDESLWRVEGEQTIQVAENFNEWLKTQRALQKQANDKKVIRAARAGDIPRLQRLLRRGADINEQDASGNTPLMAAMLAWQYEAATFLLKQQPDLSLTDNAGHTALMWAAYRNQPTLVQFMIEQGADVHARTHSGEGLLYFALTGPRSVTEGGGKGSREVVEILLASGLSLKAPQLSGDRSILQIEASETDPLLWVWLMHGNLHEEKAGNAE